MRWFGLVLLMVMVCSLAVAETDISATIHVHSKEGSDGYHSMSTVAERCNTGVLIMTDHLDGVARYGGNRYLADVRALSDSDTLCIPGVEVTVDSGPDVKWYDVKNKLNPMASHDVVVIGLNEQSLGELIDYLKKGAFQDIDTGLPCLRTLAQKYGVVLIAAHPDNSSIPFNLEDNAKYVDGFELFDSSIWGFNVDGLKKKFASWYSHRDMVTLTAGSDYHGFIQGAIPAWSPLEMPVTRIILAGDMVSEQAVIGAIRSGRTYATSMLTARASFMTCFPGEAWVVNDTADKFKIRCKGMSGKLLHDNFTVFVNGATEISTTSFEPRYEGDEAVLIFDFASLNMPDAISMNIDMGGRLVMSSIRIRLAITQLQPALQLELPDQPEVVGQPPALPSIPPTQGFGGVDASRTVFLLDKSTTVELQGTYQSALQMFAGFIGGEVKSAWVMDFAGYSDTNHPTRSIRTSNKITDSQMFAMKCRAGYMWSKGTAVIDALYAAGELAQQQGAKTVVLVSDMDDTCSRHSIQDVLSLYDGANIKCIMLIVPARLRPKAPGDNGSKVYLLSHESPNFVLGSCAAMLATLH